MTTGQLPGPNNPTPLSDPLPRQTPNLLPGRLHLAGLGLRRSERLILLWTGDVVWLCAALIIAVRLRADWLDQPGAVLAYWRWFVALAVVWFLVSHLLDCYDLARAASGSHSVVNTGAAVILTVLIYQWIPVFSPPLSSRGLVFIFMGLAVIGIAVWRAFYALAFAQPTFHRRAIIMGAGLAGTTLIEALRDVPAFGNPYYGSGYEVVGFVDDDPAKLAETPAGLQVLGDSGDLASLAARAKLNDVVVAVTHRHTLSQEALNALLACREQGINITTMPAFYEHLLGRVPVEHVGGDLAAVLPIRTGPMDRFFHLAKRLMDVVLAVVGLVLFALLAPFLAIGNMIGNPGPLFYRQARVGRGGRDFTVVKLRSMLPDAERTSGAVWSTANDSRITPFGRFLRKSRLDELPQFWNVLKGDMSVIGPRPERPEFVDQLAGQIPFYRARHAVRPGITGWAQVRYGYGSSVDDSRVKLEYDLYYVRNAGLYLDLLIATKTVGEMLRLKGR